MTRSKLLIIDDEIMLLKVLKRALEDCADDIDIAENGAVALEKMRFQKYHCVICDINMPKMNGVDLIKQVRAEKNDVPFIFYTGYGNHDLMVKALRYGAFDFLDKPNMDGLEDAVSSGIDAGLNKESDKQEKAGFVSAYKKMVDRLTKKGS